MERKKIIIQFKGYVKVYFIKELHYYSVISFLEYIGHYFLSKGICYYTDEISFDRVDLMLSHYSHPQPISVFD